MKYYILLFFCFGFFSFAQRTIPTLYFGVPKDSTEVIISGDKIITNLPKINYNRGTFYFKDNQILDEILLLSKKENEHLFEVKMNRCLVKGNKEYKQKHNENLINSLKRFFKNENVENLKFVENYTENCDKNLIPNKEDKLYVPSGNYLEITVL